MNAALPGFLRSLLLETNGVMDMMAIDGGDWFESMWLLWKIEEVVEQNHYYRATSVGRTYDRDFSDVVFFAGAGTDGILLAFPVEDGICAPQVAVWHLSCRPTRDGCVDDSWVIPKSPRTSNTSAVATSNLKWVRERRGPPWVDAYAVSKNMIGLVWAM